MLTAKYRNDLKQTVNVRRFNKIVKNQKLSALRLKYFVSKPRLVRN